MYLLELYYCRKVFDLCWQSRTRLHATTMDYETIHHGTTTSNLTESTESTESTTLLAMNVPLLPVPVNLAASITTSGHDELLLIS